MNNEETTLKTLSDKLDHIAELTLIGAKSDLEQQVNTVSGYRAKQQHTLRCTKDKQGKPEPKRGHLNPK